MDDKAPVYLFHLYRKNGTGVFLHPFLEKEAVFKILERERVVGLYGREPRVEAMTLFRNELYRIVEQEVRDWVTDRRFVPRFLISSGLFLVAYIFLSFVIRDPLPVLDELTVSLIAAISTYVFLGKRYMKSDMALKKRILLRSKVDAIVFNESDFVKRVEDDLHTMEDQNPETIFRSLAETGARAGEEYRAEAEQLCSYLNRRFRRSDFRKQEKRIARAIAPADRSEERERAVDSVSRWINLRKIDLPLYALYLKLKRESVKN